MGIGEYRLASCTAKAILLRYDRVLEAVPYHSSSWEDEW